MSLSGLCRKALFSRTHRLIPSVSRNYYLYSPEPFHPFPDRKPPWMTAQEAVSAIKSGDTVFVQGAAGTPITLADAMAEHGKAQGLTDVKVCHMHTEGPATYAQPEYKEHFRSNSFFIGGNLREPTKAGRADCIPIFLSEIPLLFRRKLINLDVALVTVTAPDKHGYCSLGTSIDCTRAAVQNAKHIIGLVNKQMPRTFGDGQIHESHFDALVQDDRPLPELKKKQQSEQEAAIGRSIAQELVQDGATLQLGIGSIPDAVLSELGSHRDLGVHSEMISDGVVDLMKTGAITNTRKVNHAGLTLSSFCIGTRKLYDFLDDNPSVGFGGQIDFIRGASLSQDGKGKPIIALPSQTKRGESKIVPFIKEGAGVVTTRAHVHYVVTEFGIASLFGKSLRQRAYELIKIAHPDHRQDLEKAAFERLKCMPSP